MEFPPRTCVAKGCVHTLRQRRLRVYREAARAHGDEIDNRPINVKVQRIIRTGF